MSETTDQLIHRMAAEENARADAVLPTAYEIRAEALRNAALLYSGYKADLTMEMFDRMVRVNEAYLRGGK